MTTTDTTEPTPTAPGDDYAIAADGITKRFEAVEVLRGVSIRLRRGEVLGLIGDNGAGKSTLMKILNGFHPPDAGEIRVNGEEVVLRSVTHARDLGIETVYQDLALIDELPVYLNLFLNKELVRRPLPLLDKRRMRRVAREQLDDMGVNIPSVGSDVAFLSGGQRQAIAVARAVYSDAKIILLDEPLAAMGAKEAGIILNLVRQLKERGDVSIIMIAHNYAQIVDVCDRVNLLQHGEITYDKRVEETSVPELTEMVAVDYRMDNGDREAGWETR